MREEMREVGIANDSHPTVNGFFICFLCFWSAATLIAFSAAGEKMPWLTVHMVLPCILLGGYVVGQWATQADWKAFNRTVAWVGWIILPVLLLTTAWSIGKWMGTNTPFTSETLEGMQSTSEWISTTLISMIGWLVLIRLWRANSAASWLRQIALAATGWLFVLTVHTAFQASFIDANKPNEFLYYAQFAPGVRTVNQTLIDLVNSNPVGSALAIEYDTSAGWTYDWYLRDYPNATAMGNILPSNASNQDALIVSYALWPEADRRLLPAFRHWEGIRIWWPLMDYMNLSAERLQYALEDASYRQALWDIWYYRDFRLYSRMTNQDLTPERWPVSERMRLYYRP
jgi:hypothetical protein